jgi:nicotinamide phosphoribosyltransferase
LPIEIKALPEGSKVNMRVPVLTIVNTIPEFYWLTNFIESLMSSILWQPSTSATIAHEYRKILDRFAEETGMPKEFAQWQGHDFSFRGMSSLESAKLSGMGHLLSFTGTDTIPAIDALEQYYNANCETELIGGSVPATEHAVMCSGAKDGELETFRRLVTELYPNGIISIVSDTWDLWKVCTEYLPLLKGEIPIVATLLI